MAQSVKSLPAMPETRVWFLGQEDLLEKEMATHSSILPGEFHGQSSLAVCSPRSLRESDTTEWLTLAILQNFLIITLTTIELILFYILFEAH